MNGDTSGLTGGESEGTREQRGTRRLEETET